MNNVYKSVFNEATGTCVAVSEIKRSRGKKAKLVSALVVALALAIGFSGGAQAQSIAIGTDSTTTDDGSAVATGANSIAIGTSSEATASGSIAIGTGDVRAAGTNSISIGQTIVNGTDSMAIGYGASGMVNGTRSGSFGNYSNVVGNNSYSVGNSNSLYGTDSFILGNNGMVSIDNSVALGNRSEATAAVATTSTTIAGTNYNFAGSTPAGVVSVGGSGGFRQIQNVAAGQITSSSTDAINGSQLFATNSALDKLAATVAAGGTGTSNGVVYDTATKDVITLEGTTSTDGGATGGTTITNVHQGAISATSTDAINGTQLFTLGNNVASIIGGNTVYDPTTNTYTTSNIGGTGASTIDAAIAAVNTAATDAAAAAVTAKSTVSAGTNVVVTPSLNANGSTNYEVATAKNVAFDSTTVGTVVTNATNVDAAGNTIVTGVGAGSVTATSTDAVNGAQLYAVSQSIAAGTTNGVKYDTTTKEVITLEGTTSTDGGATGGTTITNVHQGALTATSTDAVNGTQLYTTNQAVSALQAGAVQYGTNPDGSVNYSNVTLGGGAGNTTIHNVAAGVANTDAVNVGQLNSAVDSGVARANDYTDSKIKGFDKDANAGIAAAMAMQMPTLNIPGRVTMHGGAAFYRGQSAYAVSGKYTAKTSRWNLGVAASVSSRGTVGVSVGGDWVMDWGIDYHDSYKELKYTPVVPVNK